ncbi:hypothetical protein CVT26_010402 [Gymnopilus dilepis]|uniref:Uncharacterized protein n=1 Tax=Gymnopilus dilepis TaxID=231916 RepID=A0A409VZ46_9AGAR|nr:hypothetical protein CVT26_010402 [Gymnopilus dilepis]
MKVYQDAQQLNAAGKEQLLKQYGLRDAEVSLLALPHANILALKGQQQNVFWDFNFCNPYQAQSFDGLHAHESGLFADHIFPELKRWIDALGKSHAKLLDDQIDRTPRWRGLNHFSAIMKVEFTDGGKYGDIAKLVLFAAYNILTETASPGGYGILRLLRKFLELHMYTALSLHTESTIKAGEESLLEFEAALKEYRIVSPEKNWEFIKAHSHKHAFSDITRKGVSSTFSTKPNEKAHNPIKDFYQLNTNFKNFGIQVHTVLLRISEEQISNLMQILKLNEKDVISTVIREQLDILDEHKRKGSEEESTGAEEKKICTWDRPCFPEFNLTRMHG